MSPARGADRRRLLVGRRRLGLPNQSERQNCKARQGPAPRPVLGPKGSRKSACDYGRVECASKFGSCDGAAGVQVRGRTRRRRASAACSRRMGCRTDMCSPPQPATLHAGVRHVIIKAGAHGGPLRCTAGTGRRRGALRMWFVAHAWCTLGARCIVPVGHAVRLFGRCRGLHRAGRAGY